MFALVNSGFDEDDDMLDLEAKEEKQYADYNEAINVNEIVGCVAVEPTYEDDDYIHEDHQDLKFDDCRTMRPGGGPIPHEKAELEFIYFTGSDMGANIQGYNPDAVIVRPEAAREEARRPTSNAPSDLTQDSLKVVVNRVCLLLNKPDGYFQSVIDTFGRIGIRCCHALYYALTDTCDDRNQAEAFTRRFEESSHGLVLCHKQLSFFRCASMYMHGKWEYNHEYFQRMIEWEQRTDTEAVGVIITNMRELFHDDSSSPDRSISGLQERAREDSSSSEGSYLPPLVPRGQADFLSDGDTESVTEDGIYNDDEPWGYKAFSLNQIIGGNSNGLLSPSRPTLYTFSLHGYAQVH